MRFENQEKKLAFIQFDNFKHILTIPLNSTENKRKLLAKTEKQTNRNKLLAHNRVDCPVGS